VLKHNFPSDWLSHTFTIATFGNGIVAIVAGLLSSLVVLRFGMSEFFSLFLSHFSSLSSSLVSFQSQIHFPLNKLLLSLVMFLFLVAVVLSFFFSMSVSFDM
jgi:hypothetical protein